ncbi:MAG: MarR family winged helix-turn-helix transcriptional regulator [candidate division Zixibacteria bacterium]|nr:MarR family winged helix-turn-helix transcriptional regulator [candidate division Zixibacteria bacterium]
MDRKTAKKLSECTCFNLRKASRAVTQMYEAALEPAGLRAPQFGILAAVAATKSVTITRLAEILVMDRTTLTRNLKPLTSRRLVKVLPGADRRSKKVELTKKGSETLLRAVPLHKGAQARIESGLDGQWPNMLSDLTRLIRVAQKS